VTDQMSAVMLRRWAMQCAAQAENPRASGNERERLLKMRTALLQLAETQDWLEGQAARRVTAADTSPHA
jgi:hypothetical protein